MTHLPSPKFDLYLRALHLLGEVSQQLRLSESLTARCQQLCEKHYQVFLQKYQIPRTILALIYLVSHDEREAVSLHVLEKILQGYNAKQNRGYIKRTADTINEHLGLKIKFFQPIDYLPVLLEKIQTSKLSKKRFRNLNLFFGGYFSLLERYSYQILDCLEKKDRVGRNPFTLTGSIIAGADTIVGSMFDRKHGVLNQRKIAEICEMNEYTMRDYYLKIVKPIIKLIDYKIS